LDDPWFNILRTRLRHVERARRSRWTDDDLREWAELVTLDRTLAGRKLQLPPFGRVKEICLDLIGENAVE
jgi:hypothetical protein